jgi:hypothetical protein
MFIYARPRNTNMKSEVLFTIIFGSIAAALAIIAIVQSHLQHKNRGT